MAELQLQVLAPRLWAPDHPWLYKVRASVVVASAASLMGPAEATGEVVDACEADAGLRVVSVVAVSGHLRFAINGQPLFMLGTLDQVGVRVQLGGINFFARMTLLPNQFCMFILDLSDPSV